MQTLGEIRDNLKSTTGETQINDLIDEFVNLTLMEINDPAWATNGKYDHNWSFNRRKHSFTTVADTEYYQLPRDLDTISLVRQTESPQKIIQIPEYMFHKAIPDPDQTGNPRIYRLWEEEGVETRLAVADTIDVVSSSTSDGSSISVSIVGYDANGIKQSESLSLNGTTAVNGTITYAANRPLRISKSAQTTGDITVTENSGGTTLVILGQEERSPRFKVMGLYPIPDAAISIYLEYYTRIRRLTNDADVPDIDSKWIWVVRLGALAKIYQHQEPDAQRVITANELYRRGVETMIMADINKLDYLPHLTRQNRGYRWDSLADRWLFDNLGGVT